MKDFIQYVFYEVKNKRLSKTDAIELIRQYQTQIIPANLGFLHPLLQQNTSSLSEQRFSATFTGEEFFLADHIVKGQKVLPGVTYLEMARAAMEQAVEVLKEGQAGVKLKNVVWARPIVVGEQPVQVHIGLHTEENGEIFYEIYMESSEANTEPVMHSQGSASLIPAVEKDPTLDLSALQAQCSKSSITANECYKAFKGIGLEYGLGFRGIEKLHIGEGQVLAKLSLPSSVLDTKDQYTLHPSIMDSALQASIGLLLGTGDGKAALPYALQELEILGKCTPVMWALVRYSSGSKAGDKVQKLDIDICDETGNVCVRIKGFSSRVLEDEAGLAGSPAALGTLMLEPCWKEQTVAGEVGVPGFARHLIILCEMKEVVLENIMTQMNGVNCITLQSEHMSIEERFQAYAVQIFEEIRNILKDKPKDRVLIQLVTSTQDEHQLFSGLSGLVKTAQLENTKLTGQLIEVEPMDKEGIIEKLKDNSRCPGDSRIRYKGGKRYVAGWNEVKALKKEVSIPWKDGGTYLITGGAGGLGLIFVKEIVQQVKNATLILTGRSLLSEDKQAKLEELRTLGARIEYKRVDITEKEAVNSLIQSILDDFGSIHGIIHVAGVIQDNYILKKSRDELQEVLAPKVTGLVNLDLASKELSLDFFILFSSIAGAMGNPGQADYSTANAFMDAYAGYRNALMDLKQRGGRTLSINWPLWRDGGMQVDEETEKIMLQSMGMAAMQTSTGIQALYQSLASGMEQVIVMEGNLARMKQKMLTVTASQTPKQVSYSTSGIDTGSLQDKVQEALTQTISQLLKVKIQDIDADSELSEYGFDSISFTEFANKLNQEFKLELAPTIFFEYSTISSFTEYLLQNYEAVLSVKLEVQTKVEAAPVQVIESKEAEIPKIQRWHSRLSRTMVLPISKSDTATTKPIAIVGMSGIFPKAKDIKEFWKNLVESKDCITEIPKDRWDWQELYGDPTKESNKTNIKWGGFIDGVAEFDPLFFGISPTEAEFMDPQQRLLMIYVWKVIEDAGYAARSLIGTKTAIFVGTASSGYSGLITRANIAIEGYSSTGNVTSVGPNRMSYFLNIHGPSEPIETACSSSLVALHRAVGAIRDGSCDMAIAGGVNTILTPEAHISFNKAGMLCEDGRCKTFSDKANGYVRGEGVGMLFLKKLKDAEEAGDHIYGVIRGTAENHGGRANSLTSPNPKAQAELLKTAYTKAGIDPRTVTYIEAHGTGTELGDPIEINGLKAAFKELYQETGDPQVLSSHCGLGSVKTNIGHLELAAGIAGVIKVLLQFKHKALVKSLHCDTINPYIQLKDSPFYILQESKEWKALQDSQGKDLPLRAGVSSFGFGGVNAHVVLEEYTPKNQEGSQFVITPQNPAIIVLSARNNERLKEQARQLLAALENREYSDSDLADIAYTLQMGREAMEERLGLVVGTMKELEEKLKSFIEGKDNINDLYKGQTKRSKETLAFLTADEEMKETIDKWIQNRKYGKILELWVKGLALDWNKFYGDIKPRRISVPTYPFAKERYWISAVNTSDDSTTGASTTAAFIHPLLHQNTSDLSEQRFSSTFTGKEFFLSDHVVKGQRILPGVAYLEMVRAAVEQAAGAIRETQAGIQLKNIIWVRPIAVIDKNVQVHIGLYPRENGEIEYEIYSEPEAPGAELIVHSQGTALLSSVTEKLTLDVKTLQTQCSKSSITSSQCYEAFKTAGLEYGSGHRGIEKVLVGDGQALAKLTLPSSVLDTKGQFILHPSIMDSALQASIGLIMSSGDTILPDSKVILKPSLPFALEQLEIFGECTSSMWALIRYSDGSKAGDKVQKLDIDICDEHGNICVRIKGFSSRVLEGEVEPIGLTEGFGTLMLEPCWREQLTSGEMAASDYSKHLVILCEPKEIVIEKIETQMKGVHLVALQSKQEGVEVRFQAYAVRVFEEIQSILRDKPKDRVLVQIVVSSHNEQQLFTGLFGLLKTAQMENPMLTGQLIEIETWNMEGVIEQLQENSLCPNNNRIKYQGGKRYVAEWREIAALQGETGILWKDNGIYLITGGAGGLGLIFAGEIARRVRNAALILTGRSPLGEDKKAKLEELRTLGARVEYIKTDVTQKKAVSGLIQDIQEKYGNLNGIIHSAGVIRDSYILKKTREELQEVLSPKVSGLVNLDHASREIMLDFFILFSSAAGAAGNPGQADYSAANAFMDSYASYRNSLEALKQCHGRTLSINWPLWKEGGMYVDKETEKMMLQNTGMASMQTSIGISALYQAVASSKAQVMVLNGDTKRIYAVLSKQEFCTETSKQISGKEESKAMPMIGQDSIREKAENYFKKLLSAVIKLPASQIEADAPMEKYGIESMMVMKLTNQLEKTFGSLSKTLFFEYQSIQELTGYFLGNYREQLIELLGINEKAEVSVPDRNKPVVMAEPLKSTLISRKRPRFAALQSRTGESKTAEVMEIAVIGMSGRYPQARNIQKFWENLKSGKDCIIEIPKERWDHSLYFDEDKDKPGKTYSKWGGFIDDVDRFDPLFFNISPREAEFIDPQERLFLQCVYETLEDSGYTREALEAYQGSGLEGNVGVFVGVMYEEYQLYGAQEQIQGRPIAIPGNPSSIANRVSYFFNFHGPSMAVDTMCSSSLTSIHLACQSIQRGTCELAIAGGVNVSIHPNKYLMLGQSKFTSSKGRCESFGQGGDGYVPGEGVGAVLLKPLSKAIADGDQIYGIIKGTALNHGGKTNGYTVPNPNAQAGVIGQAFKAAGIDPRTISYIEAHGTGTSLGDPIEIAGLSKTYQKYTQDKQFCAIGSAKSNIGHCESAAGIAGVTKVLLQLKYRQLVPSLHSKVLNPNIDFANTPFVVQQELTEWKRPVINGTEIPRRAGISSFGAGGSNAHVVIEEYVPDNQVQPSIIITARNPAIIILSAKDEGRLKEQAQQLLAAVEGGQYTDSCLADMTYTLQIGREAMEERLGLIAVSIKELEEKLKSFVEGKDSIEDLYRGQVKRNKEALAVLALDEDMEKTIDAWVEKGKYGKLLDLWVKGLLFDWNKLYKGTKPQRISLPTYPFERERYWVPKINADFVGSNIAKVTTASIHPLLHQNTSDLSGLWFSSTFTGQEFFLADHIVKGQRVLPGVAYLEMARAAVEQAAGALKEGEAGIQLKDVVWIRPIKSGEHPVKVHIGIYPEENGEISFEIYSESEANLTETVVHSQGRAVFSFAAEDEDYDIKSLQAECSRDILLPTELYEAFRTMGIDYGPGHRGIEKVYLGQERVLAKLTLPSSVTDTLDTYVLHPSLMDSALQATIGLMMHSGQRRALLPFALETLEILGKCTTQMWAYIRFSDGAKSANEVQKLDIDLCDETGRVCVRMTGFSSRAQEGKDLIGNVPEEISSEAVQPLVGNIMLAPVWDTVSIERVQTLPLPMDEVVIIGGTEDNWYIIKQQYPKARTLEIQSHDTIDAIAQKLETQGFINHIVWISPYSCLKSIADDALIENQEQGVLKAFRTIKALLGLGYGSRELCWSIITTQTQAVRKNDVIEPAYASLHGLVGSMAKEYPDWKVRLIDLEAGCEWPFADIFSIPADPQGNALAYRGREWYQQQMVPFRPLSVEKTLYRAGGVYVVIGGAGGIGEVWSEYMIRTYKARIVWIGRRQKDVVIQAKLDRLADLGPVPIYIAADATDLKSLSQTYEEVKGLYPQINGVIHSAIMLLDQSLAKMDEGRFKDGLSAKVDVSVRMAQVFQKETLDFVMFFSSMQSFTKAPGQSNYASGCTFKDAFARQLAQEWNCSVKVMNWGYWGSVGIVSSEAYKERMAQAGVGSIEPSEAMEALETLLSGTVDQIMFVKTTKPIVMEKMKTEELITVYPGDRLLNIQSIQDRISITAKPTDALEAYCFKAGIDTGSMKSERGL